MLQLHEEKKSNGHNRKKKMKIKNGQELKKGGRMKIVKDYKYLEETKNEKGTDETTIEKRINQAQK